MAWSISFSWEERMVTANQLDQYLRDNLEFLSTHGHSGADGDGSNTLAVSLTATNQGIQTMPDNEESPSVTGRLHRNGTDLEYYNGSTVVQLNESSSANVASPRKLGTGATVAAAGDHTTH